MPEKLSPKVNPILEGATKKDYLIVCGDFGGVWAGDNVRQRGKRDLDVLREMSETCPCTILFVDGNHENFDLLHKYPKTTLLGGNVSEIYNDIFWLHRAEVFKIGASKIFTLGGGTSHDVEYRIPGVSWWQDEELNREEIDKAISVLEDNDWKVDYIITHAGPSTARYILYGQNCVYYPEGHSSVLEEIYRRAEFKHWYMGHYHEDRQLNDRMTVLYDSVIKLEV